MVAEAQQLVQGARQSLDELIAKATAARRVPDEALAEKLLKDAALISAEDSATELATLPRRPPAQLRAVGDGVQATLFWQPGPGQDADTSSVVCRPRTARRPRRPTGSRCTRAPGDSCTDPGAPVARPVQYAVFARRDGRPPSRPATAEVTLLPPVTRLQAEVGTASIALSWEAHADAEIRITRATPGAPSAPVPVAGNECRVTGLPEGKPQRFEVVAVYQGPGGAELRSRAEHVTATPMAEARPVPRLRARAVESNGAIRVQVTWPRVNDSDVTIMRSDTEPPWPFGTVITAEQASRAGDKLTGRAIATGTETGFEAGLPARVHHLVALSRGGTGFAVGRSATVAVTNPVRHLKITPFSDFATLLWEWPPTAQLAEVTWELDGDTDVRLISLADYRSSGGVRVPLGRGPCAVEVRAVIMADGKQHAAPPATAVANRVVELPVRYRVSGLPSVGPFGGRAKKVAFTAAQACAGVRVRMVAYHGRVMPTSATDGVTVLETALDLDPGIPVEHKVSIPKSVKRPYWVRCFVLRDLPGSSTRPLGT